MPAPQRIHELVENFKGNFSYYQSNEYNEEQLRTEFLNPFFEALGWDMENKHAKGADRDVHYEKLVHGKSPDFGFYLDKKLRFFVEAKKPALDICNNQNAALQLRGYGWSAKTARGILTDFEELSIYDTAVRPKSGDTARIARIDCIKFDEYVDRWDEIFALFSREAVLGGSLEKLTKKRAQQEVDDELLEDISKWRDLLAHNIANRNDVSEERLNRIVQDTIARILFLRICEDRGIAHEGDLSKVIEGEDFYPKLYKLFKKAEQRYDSDLFEVASIADLKIDDKVLRDVISELYFPKSPYKFDAIPAEILGQVYEQFLGKVIRLTPGGRAKVDLKPEVRKAGGIYYTPTYIVEYIVQNTVGKLVEGKTPKKIETLSIVDPACGSGSFLLGAYKFLADWYRDWYVADNAEKHQKALKIYQDKDEQWQLTLEEKKRILTAHIYGVDLDRQAVEMAKLSLMLEALRSPEQQSLFNDRMLPRLGDNIKCGNSLIASDFSEVPEDLVRVNAFDWPVQFERIMKAGGFDAVIGNPPYGRLLDEFAEEYVSQRFSGFSGTPDVYVAFIERGIEVLRSNGRLSFIVPSAWLGGPAYRPLRERMLQFQTETVVALPFDVFADAFIDTAIFVLSKTAPVPSQTVRCFAYGKKEKLNAIQLREADYSNVPLTIWKNSPDRKFILSVGVANLVSRLQEASPKRIKDFIEMRRGVLFDKSLLQTDKTQKNSYPYFEGDVYRYDLNYFAPNWIEYGSKMKEWPKEFRWFEGRRLLMRRLVNRQQRLMASVAEDTFITNKNLYSILVRKEAELGEFGESFMLGVLNSRLISRLYLSQVQQATKDDFPQVTITDVLALPCPVPSKGLLTKVAEHAEKLLLLVTKLRVSTSDSEKATLQNVITTTDQKIDALVYKLYGLTDEEIRIVEESK